MKLKILLFLLISIVLFACDAAEDLFTTRNAPEIISIKSDKGWQVNPGDTVTITVEANNPEDGELSYKWSVEAGSIIGNSYESLLKWKAPLTGGPYTIEIEVSNEYKSTKENVIVEVKSNINPYVNINQPHNGDYIVQFTHIDIKFEAIHSNGIAQIFIYINDQKIDSLVGITRSDYIYDWEVVSTAGEKELKIEAISRLTEKISADSINVTIEGIIPGKSGD